MAQVLQRAWSPPIPDDVRCLLSGSSSESSEW
jgi:hypothetical protein